MTRNATSSPERSASCWSGAMERTRGADFSPATTRTSSRRRRHGPAAGFIPAIWCGVGADGSFFFVDRSKNVIRRSGENIAAVEVESALQAQADVLASAVCPVADEVRGEEVFAFVVLRPGAVPSVQIAAQLQSHCRQALAYYKIPGYIAFRPELPQTASQKLARARIKEQAAGASRPGKRSTCGNSRACAMARDDILRLN